MMKISNIIPLVSVAVLSFSAVTNAFGQNVQKFTASKANEYALVYTLPKTSVNVVVEAERSLRKPGDFYRYSRKYLSIDPVMEQSEEWTLKSVKIYSGAVADDANRWQMQFKSGSAPFVMVDVNNAPVSINFADVEEPEAVEIPVAVEARPTILETPAARQAMTEEMLQSTSSAKRAELAAAKIYELRQNRNDIIAGQAESMPSDGAAMKLALEQIGNQEDALTAMFTGTEQISTDVEIFTVVPTGAENLENLIIGRLSATEGIVPSDDLSGEPIYLKLKVVSRGTLPKNEKGEVKKFPKGGVAYNIPGTIEATVVYGTKTYASATFNVSQLGVVFGLDPALFTDKKAPAYVTFDPTTGGVLELGTVQ